MRFYIYVAPLTIILASCTNNGKIEQQMHEDTVKIFFDSVIRGKAMLWNNSALAIRGYDSINSENLSTSKYYFEAAVRSQSNADAFLAVQLRKRVLEYLQGKPKEFGAAVCVFSKDTLMSIATGIGLEILETNRSNALEKSRELRILVLKNTSDTSCRKKINEIWFYINEPIALLQYSQQSDSNGN